MITNFSPFQPNHVNIDSYELTENNEIKIILFKETVYQKFIIFTLPETAAILKTALPHFKLSSS